MKEGTGSQNEEKLSIKEPKVATTNQGAKGTTVVQRRPSGSVFKGDKKSDTRTEGDLKAPDATMQVTKTKTTSTTKNSLSSSNDHKTPARAMITSKKRTAPSMENETTPKKNPPADASTPLSNNPGSPSKKRRSYRRTKRPANRSELQSATQGSMTTPSMGNVSATDPMDGSGMEYYPQGYNVFDNVLQESADLAQAASEAQQLGRLKMASTYLLLLHARLVGLGRRFDKLRESQFAEEEEDAEEVIPNESLMDPMEEGYFGDNTNPFPENDETQAEHKDEHATVAPCSPPSLRHTRATPFSSVNHEENGSSREADIGSSLLLPTPPTNATTSSSSLNDGSLNVEAISASVTQSLEQQQQEQEHEDNTDDNLPPFSSPSLRPSTNRINSNFSATPKTAAAKQLASMLPSHIEMDQAMMEHLAKAAAQLHAARSGKARKGQGNHLSPLAGTTDKAATIPSGTSTETATAKGNAPTDQTSLAKGPVTEVSSATAAKPTHQPQPNRAVSFTTGESTLLQEAVRAGNPNTFELARQTGRSEVQIKAFLRNLDTKKRLLKDLDLGFTDENDSNINDNLNNAEDGDEVGGPKDGKGKKTGKSSSGGSTGRGRKPSTAAITTVLNANCNARLLLRGSLFQQNRPGESEGGISEHDVQEASTITNGDDKNEIRSPGKDE